MSPDDRKRQIAADTARAVGQELASESAGLCEVENYGFPGCETAYLKALTQRGEDLIARYVERAIQADREGRAL